MRVLVVAVAAVSAGAGAGAGAVGIGVGAIVVVAAPYQPPLTNTRLQHVGFTRYLHYFRHVVLNC